MTTLGSEGVKCKGKIDTLDGGGVGKLLKLSTVGTIIFTASNNLLLNKENLKFIPIYSITGPSRTRSAGIIFPSLDQPIIPQANKNNDNQLKNILYEEILCKSLGWKYAVRNKFPLADLLNTHTNKNKGWMVEAERKRKGQSIMASKKNKERK